MCKLSNISVLLAITASLLGGCQVPGQDWGWEDAWLQDLDKTRNAEPDAERNVEPNAERNAEPDAVRYAEPDAKRNAEPDAKRNVEPNAKRNVEPNAERNVEPNAERYAEPDAERNAYVTEEVASSGNADQSQYPTYNGPRKTLAVLEFENKAKGNAGSWEIGEGMAEMLTTELFNSNRFILVERSALKEILKEQELGQTGLVGSETAVRVGSLAGAQLLIKGVVSEFEYRKEGQGFGLGLERFNLGLKTSNAHVGVDVRVIDAATGQIIASEYAKAKATSSGFSIDYVDDDSPLKIGTSAFSKTPLGEATRDAIHKAVYFIISESEKLAWSGVVIKALQEKVYINRGTNSNIHAGDRLTVYSKVEELVDPQTGINLGSIEERVGTLMITDVRDKFSIGRLQMEAAGVPVKRGDIVRLE